MRRHPGLEIHPRASSNLAWAHFELGPGARVRIGPDVVTERRAGALRILAAAGAHIEIEAGCWLRTDLGPLVLAVFEGARLHVGREAFLNGCHVSAKQAVTLGRRAFLGPGCRVFDADQHDFDADTPERVGAVSIGDHAWIAADVTVLRGVTVGEHSVVGTRSLVTRDLPPHSLAFGSPASVRGQVGDRSTAR